MSFESFHPQFFVYSELVRQKPVCVNHVDVLALEFPFVKMPKAKCNFSDQLLPNCKYTASLQRGEGVVMVKRKRAM